MIRFLEVHQTALHPRWLQVRRETDLPDGTVHEDVHCFPIETLALRAGEYGLPLTDPWALLEVVTYEGTQGFHEPDQKFPLVVTEPTIAAGRLKHLERVAKFRAEHEGRAGRRSLAAQRERDARHTAVGDRIILRSDLSPELAELGRWMLEQHVYNTRAEYVKHLVARRTEAAILAAADGNGTSTLLGDLVRRQKETARGNRNR